MNPPPRGGLGSLIHAGKFPERGSPRGYPSGAKIRPGVYLQSTSYGVAKRVVWVD